MHKYWNLMWQFVKIMSKINPWLQILTASPYKHEVVQCRTDTTCQKSKPEDYWTSNFYRRRENLQRGFYTSLTEPYRPIGGDVVLDPYELVLSSVPTGLEKKVGMNIVNCCSNYLEFFIFFLFFVNVARSHWIVKISILTLWFGKIHNNNFDFLDLTI